MLFRYSIPVLRQGVAEKSLAYYFETDHNPSQSELVRAFETELEELKSMIEHHHTFQPKNEKIAELEACISALKHIKTVDLPKLPDGSGRISTIVPFESSQGSNAIRVNLIQPKHLQEMQLRLIKQG